MRRSITLFVIIYTIIGLLVSLIVHFSLYFGLSLYYWSPTLWLIMQVGVFGGLVGALVLKPGERLPKDVDDQKAPKLFWAMIILSVFFFFYTPFNFFYCEDKLKEGYPDIVDGQRMLVLYHGAPPQQLTFEQFRQAELYQARKTSGHWMLVQLLTLMMLYKSYKWGTLD